MEKYVVLYNKLSGAVVDPAATGLPEAATALQTLLAEKGEVKMVDIATAAPYEAFYAGLAADEKLVLCGGDGTLNRFINEAGALAVSRELYFYSAGTGNDFARDIGWDAKDGPVEISKYLADLPTVTVGGKTSKFINGVGFGIDGYCCEVGDEQKAQSDKPVNYTSIAINGLLFKYHSKSFMMKNI